MLNKRKSQQLLMKRRAMRAAMSDQVKKIFNTLQNDNSRGFTNKQLSAKARTKHRIRERKNKIKPI